LGILRGSGLLVLVAMLLQVCALVYYVASYIPHAQKLVRICGKRCLKRLAR
jgi:hypothetical protein